MLKFEWCVYNSQNFRFHKIITLFLFLLANIHCGFPDYNQFYNYEIDRYDIDPYEIEPYETGPYDVEPYEIVPYEIEPRIQLPDEGLNVIEMIERQGYPIEQHIGITTEDGYFLEIHRIPYGLKSGPAANKPVVFLMHGFLSSSADWITMGPEKSLAYLLADLGYDVWMGNARGNPWSRNHAYLNPNRDRQFWNFSWHEIGIYDLPAMIDYIRMVTNQEKLYYIGHSQGTTSFFVMCAERPEYNNKIRLFVALSPVAFFKETANPFIPIFSMFVKVISSTFGIAEITGLGMLRQVGRQVCRYLPISYICSTSMSFFTGFNSKQLNKTMLPVILSNSPASCSTKQLYHYGQLINSGEFRQYDNSGFLNWFTPPPLKYDLHKISAPVALYHSRNDYLSSVKDVNHLAGKLTNVKHKYLVTDQEFNHLDFLWAIDVVPLLYDDVILILQNY